MQTQWQLPVPITGAKQCCRSICAIYVHNISWRIYYIQLQRLPKGSDSGPLFTYNWIFAIHWAAREGKSRPTACLWHRWSSRSREVADSQRRGQRGQRRLTRCSDLLRHAAAALTKCVPLDSIGTRYFFITLYPELWPFCWFTVAARSIVGQNSQRSIGLHYAQCDSYWRGITCIEEQREKEFKRRTLEKSGFRGDFP